MDAHDVTAGVLALPDDIQADILRRLGAHSLARCRCACAPWQCLVDARGLLRPHTLPRRAFPGFFANLRAVATEPWRKPGGSAVFLPPPASRAHAVDRLAFLRPQLPSFLTEIVVRDQCNGLVLCFWAGEPTVGFVCNPTTQRWARLPDPPDRWPRGHDGAFLAFDPAVSLDYEAFLLPVPAPRGQSNGGMSRGCNYDKATLGMFMPESFLNPREEDPGEDGANLLPVLVFSSASGRWRSKLLAPGRCAPARLFERVTRRGQRRDADTWAPTWRAAVYRGGTLYAHCGRRVLVALRCAEGTYDMVKLPSRQADPDAAAAATERYAAEHVLAGLPVSAVFPGAGGDVPALRYARVDAFRVRVWALQELPDGQLSWAQTHDRDLAAHARMLEFLHDAPSNRAPPEERASCVWFSDGCGEDTVASASGDGRWNWDDAGLLDMEVGEGDLPSGSPPPFSILGCHASGQEEVVYLASGAAFHVVAYHLGSGKVRYMGRVVSLDDRDRLDGVFAYRPCIVDALPNNSWCVSLSSLSLLPTRAKHGADVLHDWRQHETGHFWLLANGAYCDRNFGHFATFCTLIF